MSPDEYRSRQSAHALEQKALRAIMDQNGVTISQARSVLHREDVQANFNRFAAINQANQLAPKPAPKFEAVGAKLEIQPILPPVAVGGAGGPPQVPMPAATSVTITYCNRDASPIANATINVLTVP